LIKQEQKYKIWEFAGWKVGGDDKEGTHYWVNPDGIAEDVPTFTLDNLFRYVVPILELGEIKFFKGLGYRAFVRSSNLCNIGKIEWLDDPTEALGLAILKIIDNKS
jgi:hypothetical protein